MPAIGRESRAIGGAAQSIEVASSATRIRPEGRGGGAAGATGVRIGEGSGGDRGDPTGEARRIGSRFRSPRWNAAQPARSRGVIAGFLGARGGRVSGPM